MKMEAGWNWLRIFGMAGFDIRGVLKLWVLFPQC
jgi:hypothetical protein